MRVEKVGPVERLLSDGVGPPPSVAVVAAHPDDETIGVGNLLPRLREVTLIHVTDGAPRDRRWWGGMKFAPRNEYARARRDELRAALALAGVEPGRTRSLGVVDQEASRDLTTLACRLLDALYDVRPEVVLTHSYEGGHPDHDATAFAVHAACGTMQAHGTVPPVVAEFASYHAGEGGIRVGEFLPSDESSIVAVLGEAERDRKRRMIECFATQQETLRQFPIEVERFRRAPRYDFTRPPHPGRLFYENFEWGAVGEEWRVRAGEALRELGLDGEVRC